jgi:hypothetical protein
MRRVLTAVSTLAALFCPSLHAPATAEPSFRAGYDRGFFLSDAEDRYRVALNMMLQLRYAYDALEGAADRSRFSVPRARLSLSGHLLSRDLTYKVTAEFGNANVSLLDAFVDFAIAPDLLHVRAGAWKVPYSRGVITSATRMDFPDPSSILGTFGTARDIGVGLHNDYERSPELEWFAGVFNGTGNATSFLGTSDFDPATGVGTATVRPQNTPGFFRPIFVARIGLNLGGMAGYSEADLEGGAPRFAAAASTRLDLDLDGGDDASSVANVDLAFKAYGLSMSGAFLARWAQTGRGYGDQDLDVLGAFVQAGYVIDETVEPIARYEVLLPEAADGDRHTTSVGANVFLWGQRIRWQGVGALTMRESASGDRLDWVLMTQLHLSF